MKICLANFWNTHRIIELLSQLEWTGNPLHLSEDIFDNIYVAKNEDNVIIGVVTFRCVTKITHNGSNIAHIEDLVVDNKYRNMGVGKLLIDYCIKLAKNRRCYKIILNCTQNNKGFYEKCGFKESGVSMDLNLDYL